MNKKIPTTSKYVQTFSEEGVQNVPMLYPDGVWKCGNCTNMGQMRLMYSEAIEQDTNIYEEYEEKLSLEIQVASLKS